MRDETFKTGTVASSERKSLCYLKRKPKVIYRFQTPLKKDKVGNQARMHVSRVAYAVIPCYHFIVRVFYQGDLVAAVMHSREGLEPNMQFVVPISLLWEIAEYKPQTNAKNGQHYSGRRVKTISQPLRQFDSDETFGMKQILDRKTVSIL